MYRTDIRGYYRHIGKVQLKKHTEYVYTGTAPEATDTSVHWIQRGRWWEFHPPLSGIPRGCALSPLPGASFLWYVDGGFERERGLFYVRYMDDFLFLSPRRWPVRRAIARLHTYSDDTGFTCHPDRTMAGQVEKGFDWLGVWFDERGPVGTASRAMENHRARCLRLEEQALCCSLSDEQACARGQQYEVR